MTGPPESSLGARVSDAIASYMGSWNFILLQSAILLMWAIYNTIPGLPHYDAFPFIFLNLFMSAEAAYATPLLLMSQNRQSEKDRAKAELDYEVDLRGEEETRRLLHIIESQEARELVLLAKLSELQELHIRQHEKIDLLLHRTIKLSE